MPYCPKCGAKLPITPPAQQPPATQQSAVQQPAYPSYIPQVSEEPTKPPVKKSPGEWIAIGCGGIILGIILLIIVSAFITGMTAGISGSSSPPSTTAIPPPSTVSPSGFQILTKPQSTVSTQDGSISIKTYPGGAQIFLNGDYIGYTYACDYGYRGWSNCQPYVIQKPPGTYQIELKQLGPYYIETVNAQVNGGETTKIEKFFTRVPVHQE
jgi:hypothetical protein